MTNRVQWDPRLGVGNETIDAQHQAILTHIDQLAECLMAGDAAGDARFLEIFAALKDLARDHFATEEALLAQNGCPQLDDHRHEQQEYGVLESDIITTANFDKAELQTFLSLWWTGHIVGNSRELGPWLAPQAAS